MTSCRQHYSPHTLALDLSGDTPPHYIQRRLETCATCRAAKNTLDLWARRTGHDDPAVWPEYATAPGLLAQLLPLSPARRLAVVRYDELYQHWGLLRLVLEESREAGYSAPAFAAQLAELAVAIAMCLPEDYYQAHAVADQRALAWANLARVKADEEPGAARRAADEAVRWRGRGTGAVEIARHIEELLASVRPDDAGEETLREGRTAVSRRLQLVASSGRGGEV